MATAQRSISATLRLPRWPGWQHLPRDARDTVFQLGVIAWIVGPHLLHRPWWCGVLVVMVLAWRLKLAVAGAPLPHRFAVSAVLALGIGLTWWQERSLFGKEAGVTLLVMLMALKTLELRARRDALVVFFLGFFLVLTHYLYSQSLPTAIGTLVAVWGLLTALVLAHMPVGRPTIARAGAVAARAAAWAVPLMALLFVLFPRIGPLWGLPQDAAGRTGLSGSLRMGGVASVANDESVAMRVRFFGAAPPPQSLYFRGPVLTIFDGFEWNMIPLRSPPTPRMRPETQLMGAPVRYELTIEPSRLSMLPMLELTPDRPDSAPQPPDMIAAQRHDGQWQTSRPVTERLRLEAQAWPVHRVGPRAGLFPYREYIALPAGFNPRTLAFAARLKADPKLAQADARTLADALMQQFAFEDFSYTLEPGGYGRDAVDEFLFDRKLGFCEHFAAAFVVLMRAMEVPARIVTGYQGTDPVPVDGYFIVRQSHAHAWAEYWVAGHGWVRADPTAAVAPERIRRSQSLQAPPGLVAQALGAVSPQLLAGLKQAWEALDNRWNQWVLNYSRGQQFDLLRRLGIEGPNWTDLALALIGLLSGVSLLGAVWAWWDRHRQDPWQRLQSRVQEALAAMQVSVGPHDAPRARAARLRERLGPAGEPLAAALEELDRSRYGHGGAAVDLRRWWHQFKRSCAAAAPALHAGAGAIGTPPRS